jgi:hypothetical protein
LAFRCERGCYARDGEAVKPRLAGVACGGAFVSAHQRFASINLQAAEKRSHGWVTEFARVK